jgi:hypothetical protein
MIDIAHRMLIKDGRAIYINKIKQPVEEYSVRIGCDVIVDPLSDMLEMCKIDMSGQHEDVFNPYYVTFTTKDYNYMLSNIENILKMLPIYEKEYKLWSQITEIIPT